MFMGISAISDNNLPSLAGESPFCPCKTDLSLHLCSCEPLAFKVLRSRGYGRWCRWGEALPCLPAPRAWRCKLWQMCLLLTNCYEYRHGSPQPGSYANVYLKPGKFPWTAGKKLCSALLYCYPSCLLSSMLLAGACVVAPPAPLLSIMLPLSWLRRCSPSSSEQPLVVPANGELEGLSLWVQALHRGSEGLGTARLLPPYSLAR